MFTKIYLIRHGETEGAEVRRYKGHIDVPLSEHGVEQMKRVAEHIVQDGSVGAGLKPAPTKTRITAVYCSDLSRAIKSAEIIAGPHGLKPAIMPELRERNFGIWEGMSFDEIKEKWPDAFNAWADNPLKFSPMGGESTIEVRERAVIALEKILRQNKNNPLSPPFRKGGMGGFDNIAIIAHGGINRVILCELLGVPLENIFRVEQDYGCLNVIEIWDKYPVVKLINGGSNNLSFP
ncbi:MAG: histidine phosphatase family protein [Nitrospirae bacterium]|nr:histidine phosphatase family protein [Nitrospirota bacterium]